MDLNFREILADEDYVLLTELLHRSYKKWAQQGLKFLAAYQPPEKTKLRCAEGRTILAEAEGATIGLITINDPKNSFGIQWYERCGVTSFHQFAIDPKYQGFGFGSRLLAEAERYAKAQGLQELALDTSEKAHALIEYYNRRGYRPVDKITWDHTNYMSVVLSKALV